MASPTTLAIYERLPQYIRDADTDEQLLAFVSLLGDQVDEIVQRIDAISYYPPDDGGEIGDTSALVDATQAGTLGDPRTHLKWLAQLLGVRLNTADSIEAQIDAVRYASSGWRLGTKAALADAARSVLTGSKYVAVEPHYADDPWAINIRTRASETPDSASVVNAILAKGAKPAGTVILNVFYSATWADLETFRPTWDDWEATWTEIEETNAPGDDPDNIPDPDQGPYILPAVLKVEPGNLSVDVGLTEPIRMYYTKPLVNSTEYGISFEYEDGTLLDGGDFTATYVEANNQVYREFAPVGTWPAGETLVLKVFNGDILPDMSNTVVFGENPDVVRFTVEETPVVPQVVSVVPAQGVTNFATTDNIVVTFNMNLDVDSVTTSNFVLTETVSGAVVARAVSGGTAGPVTINPTPTLTAGTGYTLTILGNGVSGVQGESDGEFMSLNYVTSFTTAGTAPDPTPTDAPKVVSTNPANNATNQATTLEIAVRFSKSMKPSTFTSSTVVLTEVGVGTIPTTVTYNTSLFRISITPQTPIKGSTQYQVELTTGIQDTNGTSLTSPYSYTWKTAVATTPNPDPDPGPTPDPSVRIPALPSGATQTYFNDFKAPLDFTNDWWKPYDALSTDNTGTWRPSQVSVATSGDGYLEIAGIKDASKKRTGAKSDLIFGGIALGRRSMPVNSFFEFRIRIDKGNGFGLAALTWPDSNKWPDEGEDDIIEIPQGDRLKGHTTWHYRDLSGVHKSTARTYPGSGSWPVISGFDGSKWHIWRSEWRTASRRWYLDGQFVFEITDPDKLEVSARQHLSIQGEVASGSFWVTPWDGTAPSVVKIQVDWVRQGRLS